MKTYSEFITEAEKRIRMVRVHHGTSSDTAEKIKKSGFKGDEVHAATHPNTARGFAKRKGEKTSNVTMLVPKKSIKGQPEKGAKAVKTQVTSRKSVASSTFGAFRLNVHPIRSEVHPLYAP